MKAQAQAMRNNSFVIIWHLTNDYTKAFGYVSAALSKIYGKQPLLLGTGGTGGAMLSFKEVLGVYAYSLGFLQADEKWHAANEFFRVSSFRKGQMVYCYYLQQVADGENKLKK